MCLNIALKTENISQYRFFFFNAKTSVNLGLRKYFLMFSFYKKKQNVVDPSKFFERLVLVLIKFQYNFSSYIFA